MISFRLFRPFRGSFSQSGDLRRVFVAAAGEADDEDFVAFHGVGDFHSLGDGVGAFQGGEDAFARGEGVECG